MYKIFADKTLIYDSTLEDYKIGKGTISLEINKSGSFVFSVYPDHFYYDSFVKLKTVITVYRSGKIVFRGRILNDVTDYWNNKVITCEGELGFLQDSIIRPFSFNGTPADLFATLITEHNSQVDEFKRFKIGTVTVTDNNDYIARSNSEYETTLSNLNSRLIEDSLGGFFYVTHGETGDEEIPTLNYLADSVKVASQTVEFGSNLKDYTKTAKADTIATAIIPTGKDKLTIKSVNNGSDYVYNAEGVALYGWIFKTVSFDDVTNASNLKQKAQKYLNDVVNQNVTVELNAIDLHLLNRSIESINVCDYVRVVSTPHKFDATLLCNKQTLDLLKPENDSLILGYAISTITGRTNAVASTIKSLQSNTTVLSSKVQNIDDNYVKQSELQASVNTYLNSDEGKASIETAVSGNYVTQDALNGYVKETELSAQIGAYIDTQEGTAKIISAAEGTFATKDSLGNLVSKTELSTEIGQYIDTETGTAKIISAVSGTYQTKDDMSDYVLTTELNTSISQYIDTATGKAEIISAVEGTYQKKSDMSGYVTSTELSTEIGQYIDSVTGKAKIVSAVSGTYQTKDDMSDYATTETVSKIEQSVSDVESSITLSASYSNNTIGTNVYALLQLVSNANSSSIKIKADKIDFTGFTTFLRASDVGSSGSTTIDGARITTGTISADRIDVDSLSVKTIYGTGSYSSNKLLYSDSNNLYIGGTSIASSKVSKLDVYASNSISIYAGTYLYLSGSGSRAIEIYTSASSGYIRPSVAGGVNLGDSSYRWGALYAESGRLGNSSYYISFDSKGNLIPSADSSSSGYFGIGSATYPFQNIYATNITVDGTISLLGSTVKLGGAGNTTYYIKIDNTTLSPSQTSSTKTFYLGSSSAYWSYAYIGSTATYIGNSTSSKLGFFGTNPVARQTVSSSATVATLITALKAYGLIG